MPKYEVRAPAATISESYGVTVLTPSACEVTVRACRSIFVTSPTVTAILRCRISDTETD